MTRPLAPQEMYPAGVAEVATRMVPLPTGVRLRVAESGPPYGEPVVLLHGWGASLYMYRHAHQLLAEKGFRVLTPDLRGFGLSDRPAATETGSYTLDAYLSDATALLDELSLPRVALVGQSMGGGIALQLALRVPIRVTQLALINPTGLVPVSYVGALRLVPRDVANALGRAMVPRLLVEVILRRVAYGDPSLAGDQDVDEYWAPTQLPGCVGAARGALDDFDWQPVAAAELGRLAVPSVVILGNEDRLIRDARAAAERLRGSLVHVIEGGHCVHEEHPREVYDIVAGFFRDSQETA